MIEETLKIQTAILYHSLVRYPNSSFENEEDIQTTLWSLFCGTITYRLVSLELSRFALFEQPGKGIRIPLSILMLLLLSPLSWPGAVFRKIDRGCSTLKVKLNDSKSSLCRMRRKETQDPGKPASKQTSERNKRATYV